MSKLNVIFGVDTSEVTTMSVAADQEIGFLSLRLLPRIERKFESAIR